MDGDGYENVTSKVNSRSFKRNRAYFIYVNSSNVGSFFWSISWILKNCIEVQEKKGSRSRIFTSFSRRSGAVTAMQCTKKRDARAKVHVLPI